MFELTPATAADYLCNGGKIDAREPVEVEELAGGVSNVVLRVRRGNGEELILKQARGKLRVAEDWFCSVERIWREAEVLQLCSQLLGPLAEQPQVRSLVYAAAGTVPRVLWEDRENYCFAMTAAPRESKTWKELLLAGDITLSRGVASACGTMLGTLHGGSWRNAEIATRLDDRSFFDALRVDPYYRQIARVHPQWQAPVERLIDSVWQNRLSLVHGDFSPKNLLVSQRQVLLIDFEVGHYGDPAFDLGFFVTHLVLKAVRAGARQDSYLQLVRMFWQTYRSRLAPSIRAEELAALESRAMLNLAGCLLARVDGKSPVDYLSPEQQACVREFAGQTLTSTPDTWEQMEQRIRDALIPKSPAPSAGQ